ncbi:hypothetical protein BBJ29_001410 [Phytophthora kernoviae]|uniref:EF-hand domain-containing protein n=1 Tax=Phytophthora kernoviae TaxID=325452 RepID=A0A3F2RTS5_9STRA|nr:hypothetical protein BBJ29_001410 [Phytophthora kernoviae]RLN64103.1 hypothetical protein BBP00_00003657 [Phytophthora kernoviae]
MGGRFSRVQYREQDAAVLSHLLLLTQVWGLDEIAYLSTRLRRLSFNFCLTLQQFEDLVGLRSNPLFKTMLHRWFATFQNMASSSIVNGLEVLTALALTATNGKLEEKAGAVFDIFDFDDSGAITRDELGILIKSAVRGLSKATKGLGPRLAVLCPMSEVAELTRQCFVHCDLDDEQDLPRDRFVLWVKQTPKIVNLLRCFVQREYLSEDEAAVMVQRCTRGMFARREAAERRLELQLEVEHELAQAAQKIQDVVVTRKKKRERLRQQKLGHGDFVVDDGVSERSDAIFRSQFDPHTGREYPVIDLPLQLDSSYFEEMRVAQVACGYYFTMAVTEDGSVFSWGEGSDGQLGLGYLNNFQVGFLDPNISGSNFVYMASPTRIDALKEPIASVAVGGNHVFAIGRAPTRHIFEWDAQKSGAVAVVIIFDFLEADAFALEVDEEDSDGYTFTIPAVMILAAQKAGAKAVVVAQSRVDPDPTRFDMSVFNSEDGGKTPSTAGVKIPVVSIPFEAGVRMKASLEGVEAEDSQCRIALAGPGTLYAWGYAENGRLGLGDIENETLYQAGYDGARQKSYQFVQDPEVVSSLLFKAVSHVSCGEDHSAAVSSASPYIRPYFA